MKWIIAGLAAWIIGVGLSAIYNIRHEPVPVLHIEQTLVQERPVILKPAKPDVRKFAMAESGGNPKARNSSSTASGAYQFTNGTWRLAVNKWGKPLHIRLRDKNKLSAQRLMAQKLADDNARILAGKIGRQPTEPEVYIAHFLGAHDAAILILARQNTPNRKAVYLYNQAVVDSNRGIFFEGNKARTVQQICELLSDRLA